MSRSESTQAGSKFVPIWCPKPGTNGTRSRDSLHRDGMNNSPALPTLWTVDELAQYLGTGHHYVYKLTSERRIRFVRVGKTVRFRPEDVVAWLDAETKDRVEPKRQGRPRRVA